MAPRFAFTLNNMVPSLERNAQFLFRLLAAAVLVCGAMLVFSSWLIFQQLGDVWQWRQAANDIGCGCSGGGLMTYDLTTLTGIFALTGTLLAIWGTSAVIALQQLWRTKYALHTFKKITQPIWPRKLQSIARNLHLTHRISLLQDQQPRAFCAGLRPHIFVSTGLLERLSTREFEAVLRHETHHLRQADPAKQLLVDFLAKLLGWLPGVTALLAAFRLHNELAADAFASRNGKVVQPLAQALWHLLAAPNTFPATVGAAAVAVEARIALLHNPNFRPTLPLHLLAIPALWVGLVLSLLGTTLLTQEASALTLSAGGACPYLQLQTTNLCPEGIQTPSLLMSSELSNI